MAIYLGAGESAPLPLDFSVVNMGKIREFVTEGSANAAMMWDFQNYDTDRWLRSFCGQYYGAEHAAAIASFKDELVVRARFFRALNHAANNLALAVRDGKDGAAKANHLNAAKAALGRMSESLTGAQHGPFENRYVTDLIFKMKEIGAGIDTLSR